MSENTHVMIIGGRYATKASLEGWGRNIESGNVPALWTEFEFVTRKGPPERLSMWSMVDTGADLCVVPALALGIVFSDDGSVPQFDEDRIGARLYFTPTTVRGIGGTAEGLLVRTGIKLAGRQLAGLYRVVICNSLEYPIIGREVLNRFAGLLHPTGQRLLFSDCWCMRGIAACGTVLSNANPP